MGDSQPATQHSACYITAAGEGAIADTVRRCGFDLVISDPSGETCVTAAPAILIIDAQCARSEMEAQRLLDRVPLLGGHVLLLGSAEEQIPWEKWLRSGDGIFLRQPVPPDYLEELLRDIAGELPCTTKAAAGARPVALDQFGLLFGSSPPMLDLYRVLRKASLSDAAICVCGESGTGKELAARSIHAFSSRSREPFCAVNCGAIPAELVESELFGHERGSFSGADRRHLGLFERAAGGTVLLDEITEMPEELQVALLRVLETKRFRRVGGEEELQCDARLISATNRNPEGAVADGHLREDLFYRICEFGISVPPLRERGSDVLSLARRFIAEFSERNGKHIRLGADAQRVIEAYHWPGNVRELRHAMHSACRLCRSVITPAHLPDLRESTDRELASGNDLGIAPGLSLAEAERRLILATLDAQGGDRKRAARTLGISVRTLYNRLREYRAAGDLD